MFLFQRPKINQISINYDWSSKLRDVQLCSVIILCNPNSIYGMNWPRNQNFSVSSTRNWNFWFRIFSGKGWVNFPVSVLPSSITSFPLRILHAHTLSLHHSTFKLSNEWRLWVKINTEKWRWQRRDNFIISLIKIVTNDNNFTVNSQNDQIITWSNMCNHCAQIVTNNSHCKDKYPLW